MYYFSCNLFYILIIIISSMYLYLLRRRHHKNVRTKHHSLLVNIYTSYQEDPRFKSQHIDQQYSDISWFSSVPQKNPVRQHLKLSNNHFLKYPLKCINHTIILPYSLSYLQRL